MPGWSQLAKGMHVSEGTMIAWIIFSIITSVLSAWVLAHFFPKV